MLERTKHILPCMLRVGQIAPRAVAKASRGLGGCGCEGLGLGLGSGGDAVYHSGIRAPVGARRVQAPDPHDLLPPH